MPWCPRCGTGISEHEIVTEGYQERTHLSVFVKFPLLDRVNAALLVWTTTPWTLAANVAAAVNPDLTYIEVAQQGWTYYVAQDAAKIGPPRRFTVSRQDQGQRNWSVVHTAVHSTICVAGGIRTGSSNGRK